MPVKAPPSLLVEISVRMVSGIVVTGGPSVLNTTAAETSPGFSPSVCRTVNFCDCPGLSTAPAGLTEPTAWYLVARKS